jgi:hypothetical protein
VQSEIELTRQPVGEVETISIETPAAKRNQVCLTAAEEPVCSDWKLDAGWHDAACTWGHPSEGFSMARSRARLAAENFVLRHQLNVLKRLAPKRPFVCSDTTQELDQTVVDDADAVSEAPEIAEYPLPVQQMAAIAQESFTGRFSLAD